MNSDSQDTRYKFRQPYSQEALPAKITSRSGMLKIIHMERRDFKVDSFFITMVKIWIPKSGIRHFNVKNDFVNLI